MKRFALVAIGAAIFLTLCDQLFHVRTETLVYHWQPQVAGQTVIVPLTFLLATVSMLDVGLRVNAAQPRATSSHAVIGSLSIVTGFVSGLGLRRSRACGHVRGGPAERGVCESLAAASVASRSPPAC